MDFNGKNREFLITVPNPNLSENNDGDDGDDDVVVVVNVYLPSKECGTSVLYYRYYCN